MPRTFPQGFYWGASTASHQVEGNTYNQWSEWEQSPARRAFLEHEGLIAKHGYENYISGRSTDHYHRFADDFALAHSLGHNATRFSIEWSRIEPERGVFDEREIQHYRDVVATCRKNNLEPFVTLWHWTVPLWFEKRGGWKHKHAAADFARFSELMTRELPDVKFWITLNEPDVYTLNSFYIGVWPPQEKSRIAALSVIHALIDAHKRAYDAIKKQNPAAQIGIAKNNVDFEAADNKPYNKFLKFIYDWGWNHYFLDRIAAYQDFIGINHYFHNRIDGGLGKNKNEVVSDLGWELYPSSLYNVITDVAQRYHRPIYVTENGLADAADRHRTQFLTESLLHLHRAQQVGADVRGYLHWSLLDNFEWDKGYWPRFGLIAVDYKTLERIPRESALVYKKICESNGLDETK